MAREFLNGIDVKGAADFEDGKIDIRALGVAGATELTSGQVDGAADFIPIYDASGTVMKKVKPDNLGVGGGSGIVGSVFGTGKWYITPYANSGNTSAESILYDWATYLSPIIIHNDDTVDTVDVHVTVAATTGATMRIGLYEPAASAGAVDRLLDIGTVAIDSTGLKSLAFTDENLTEGLHWIALAPSATVRLKAVDKADWVGHHLLESTSITAYNDCYRKAASYHASMPASITGAAALSMNTPLTGLRTTF